MILSFQVGKIKQKRGYKDQWPWNIKIYTDEGGNNKGDACLCYEDPSAAHSAGGFYNSMFLTIFLALSLYFLYFIGILILSCPSDYELRGYKISVAMAEKSAPRQPPTYGHGYLPYPYSFF